MFPLAAGVAALLIAIVILVSFARADTKALAARLKRLSFVLLLLLTLGLLATGRVGLAVLSGSLAWAALTGKGFLGFQRGNGAETNNNESRPNRTGTRMTRSEALNVLGLDEGAGEAEIRAAHRRLIQQIHPDRGGTNYLAAKINDAKDILLGK